MQSVQITLYNHLTKSTVTKRIIGVWGDSVQVVGEYAQEFHVADIMENDGDNRHDENDDCGVPYDARFPIPFCRRVLLEKKHATNSVQRTLSKHEIAMVVPSNHVWLEGDNPLYSTDSRHYGPLPELTLRGRIILRLLPRRSDCTALLGSQQPLPFMKSGDERYNVKGT